MTRILTLSHTIATEKDDKDKVAQTRAKAENQFGKNNLFSGLSRVYKPLDDAGQQLPPESTSIQLTVEEVLKEVKKHLSTLFDTTATKDWANCKAKADLVVDGQTLLKEVPATYLLFLEKQLNELHALVKKAPTLDTSEVWHKDTAQNCYATDLVGTVRTKKVPQALVGHPPTKEHPAQIQWINVDVQEGTWETRKFSSAVPAKHVTEILERIEKVQRAVKHAREDANRIAIESIQAGETVLSFILG